MNEAGGTRTSFPHPRRRGPSRGASYVELMVLVALVVGAVLAGARVLGGQQKETSATLGEHVRALDEVRSATPAGNGRNEGSTYTPQSAACDATHGCEGAPTAGAVVPDAKAAAPVVAAVTPQPERSAWDHTVSFGKGVVVDGVWGTVTGLWDAATDPVGTAQGMYAAASDPVGTWNAVSTNVATAWAEDPARVLGSGLFQVVTSFTPAGVSKVATVAKVGEVAADAGTVSKAVTAARAAENAAALDARAAAAARALDEAAALEARAAAKAADTACTGPGCGLPGKSCFGAGTPVLTVDGARAIEDVHVGDVVITRDPASGATEQKPVVTLFVTPDRFVLDLGIEAGDVVEHLTVTPEHPFYAADRGGFVGAGDLVPGEHVQTVRGDAVVVSLASLPGRTTVFNLEVADDHTYFVGHTAAWVHNACSPAEVWEKAFSDIKNPGERRIAARAKVAEVAQANGWVKDPRLSRINDRDVYKGTDGRYYSVDQRHGRIEVHDKRGKHQGEMDIDLQWKKDPQTNHDLKLG